MRKTAFLTGAAVALALMANGALAADKNAEKFIKTAIQHNYAEIDVGKLAQEKGKSADVKAFGAKMVADHGAANEKAIAAAKQMGIDPPKSADAMHQASYVKMKVLSGDTFDRSFAKDMVKDHENDVKEFQKASSMQGPAGQFAKETLPTLQMHLTEAQKLNSMVNQTTGQGDRNK